MKIRSHSVTLEVPENIYWVKDLKQIIIINENAKDTYVLQDIEAIIWGEISCSNSYIKLSEMVTALLRISEKDAEKILSSTLNEWLDSGIVEIQEEQ